MNKFSFTILPGIEQEELLWLQELTKHYPPEKLEQFIALYQLKRRDPEAVLICSLFGLVAIAGIQRFLLNQIAMGILYLFTLGFCFVGSIVDAINYRKLAWEFNKRASVEAASLLGSR
ncbi:TM2 domain-containing protein [Chitinophaga defluvii]|uniref:TM2 domain-containing protein n=1 Tax=Chitinophaga defluvii TaxID=3163343 RepID=A0ABV2T8H1_9BACT